MPWRRTPFRRAPNGRFVSVDCDARPTAEEILGELRMGTDGRIRHSEGLIAAADSGTVYLGGVDRRPPDLQNKLLRIMETGRYRPMGSNTQLPCTARLILGAALLAEAIAADPDPRSPRLFRRLSFVIRMPALRERPGNRREMANLLGISERNLDRLLPQIARAEAADCES